MLEEIGRGDQEWEEEEEEEEEEGEEEEGEEEEEEEEEGEEEEGEEEGKLKVRQRGGWMLQRFRLRDARHSSDSYLTVGR